jgi:hypothetical protein
MPENERVLNNNDSPIVVSDTSTPIIIGVTSATPKDSAKPETTVCHQAATGNVHFQKNADNRYYVHDKENGNDTYRPAWLVVPSRQPFALAQANSWDVVFTDVDTNPVLTMTWAKGAEGHRGAGDITLDSIGFSGPAGGTKIAKGVLATAVNWDIDGKTDSVKLARGFVVTVNYCPNGQCPGAAANPCQ